MSFHGTFTLGVLENSYLEGLRLRVSRAIVDCQRIRCRLGWFDVHASRVRRPHRIWLRLELHAFRVRDPIAKLHRFAAVNCARICIESLNVEGLPAHLIQSRSIRFALLLLLLLSGLPLNLTVVCPSRKEYPTDDDRND